MTLIHDKRHQTYLAHCAPVLINTFLSWSSYWYAKLKSYIWLYPQFTCWLVIQLTFKTQNLPLWWSFIWCTKLKSHICLLPTMFYLHFPTTVPTHMFPPWWSFIWRSKLKSNIWLFLHNKRICCHFGGLSFGIQNWKVIFAFLHIAIYMANTYVVILLVIHLAS